MPAKNTELYDAHRSRPDFLNDPYPLYARMHANESVFYSESARAWVVIRHADIRNAGCDARLRQGNRHAAIANKIDPKIRSRFDHFCPYMRHFTSFMDPPEHTRPRGLLNKALTGKVVRELRPRVERLVTELLDRLASSEEVELLRDFAVPVSSQFIYTMLGLPMDQQPQFIESVERIFTFLGNERPDYALTAAAHQSYETIAAGLGQLIVERRRAPREDVISHLLSGEQAGDLPDEFALKSMLIGLVQGGFETTSTTITNSVFLLLRHPAQLCNLRNDPALIESAVEESLRFESPLKYLLKEAAEDFEWHDCHIRKGDTILIELAAGNRDPIQFPEPNQFEIARAPNPHLAFGVGIHFCVGASLARLQAQFAVQALFARFPMLRLAVDEVCWKPNALLRQLQALPIRLNC